MFYYNQDIQTSQRITDYSQIDASFASWFKNSNSINAEGIKDIYGAKIKMLKEQMKNLKSAVRKKELQDQIKALNNEKKRKIKEVKKADKQILAFKKLRTAFKSCSEAIDLANTESNGNDIVNIDKTFLNDYEKILNGRKEGNIEAADYSANSINNKTKELLKKTKEVLQSSRKGKKAENYIKLSEVWYRRLLAGINFSKSSTKNVRIGKSAKFNLVGEDDLSNWMGNKIKDDVKLADVIIPASHDSGAYSIVPLSATDVFAKAAQTHTVNFRGQLRAGIRYFDLRMNLENGIPVMAHDFVNGAPASEAIRQLVKFVKSHPNEVVIVGISHTSSECLSKFYELPIVKELEKYNYYTGGKVGDKTFGEIRKSGKNLLMFVEADYKTITDIYNGAQRENRDEKVMLDNEIKNLNKNYEYNQNSSRVLHKITPTHCATVKDFVSLGSYWYPLKYAANKSRSNYTYLLENEDFKNKANVVSYDDAIGSAWFTEELLKINEERMKNK